jgi:hypothetical protein
MRHALIDPFFTYEMQPRLPKQQTTSMHQAEKEEEKEGPSFLEPATGREYRAERTGIKLGSDSRKYQKEGQLATRSKGEEGRV